MAEKKKVTKAKANKESKAKEEKPKKETKKKVETPKVEKVEVKKEEKPEAKKEAPTQASPDAKLRPNLPAGKLGAGTEGSSRTGSSKDEPREEEKKEENISKSLVDQVKEGIIEEKEEKEAAPSLQARPEKSEFIAVVHVHASKNNTIVTATDLSGAETLARFAGGTVAKSGREEKTPFAGGQLARKIASELKDKGVTKVDVMLRGKGGHRGQKSPGRAASAVIKMLARSGIRIRRIEDVTPIPHGGCKAPGGKRGRRV